MPRMDASIYAAHMDNVLRLARREGGVSRPQIIEELNITRPVANGLIEKAALSLSRKDGRTEYFTVSNGGTPPKVEVKQSKQPLPEAVIESARPTSDDTGSGSVSVDAEIAKLDAQILATRNELREAAAKAGRALGEWATHQSMVDALRCQMTSIATKRMSLSS